jgi:NAD-dependent SIR2 family protein deacetylase
MQDYISSLFHSADGILILAGAGMSVDSGLPDFRGSNGMWTKAKEDFISLATARGFDDDPLASWNFYISRMLAYGHTKPHAGYTRLLDAVNQHGKDYFVVTSNVDGHFHMAGYDPARIYEIHGDLRHAQCKQPCTRQLQPMPRFTATLSSIDEIPRCARCQQSLRPNVLMFSDPSMVWTNIDLGEDRFRRWMEPRMSVLGIEIGAGTVIPSIRYIAEERTSTLIRINPYESKVNRRHDVSMSHTAVEGINTLISLL